MTSCWPRYESDLRGARIYPLLMGPEPMRNGPLIGFIPPKLLRHPRNPYLTPAMERVLRHLASDEGDGDLIAEGREVWYGDERTSPATVMRLIQLILIHDDSGNLDDRVRRYSINEEGRFALENRAYVPIIKRPETMRKIMKAYADVKRGEGRQPA